MKPICRRGLGLLLILGCTAVWIVTSSMSVRSRRTRTCQGKGSLDVIVADSLERRFVNKEDVAGWMEKEYGVFAGLPLDSVDLPRIERLVEAHSVVRSCQAWLTDDGILHIELNQRQPVVRFECGDNGYYADATGFVFPLQERGGADVPVVDGHIPMKIPAGFKGTPEKADEAAWLAQMIGLVNALRGTVWEKNIVRISVDGKKNLVFTPREGNERFLFGQPVRVNEKLGLMEAYYKSGLADRGEYRSVDVRYRKQLICRK